MDFLTDLRRIVMNTENSPEWRVLDILSRQLGDLGWSVVQEIAPSGSRPDLVATDGKGNLLCVELKLGSEPLHSHVLSTLTRSQVELADVWPGRSLVALIATNPI